MPGSKPSHFKLDQAIRSNILALSPYRCARDDYDKGILLDANENSLGHALPSDSSTDSKYTCTSPSRKENSRHFFRNSFLRLSLTQSIPFSNSRRRQTPLVQTEKSPFTRQLLPRSRIRRSYRPLVPNHLYSWQRQGVGLPTDVWNVQRMCSDQRCRGSQGAIRCRRR